MSLTEAIALQPVWVGLWLNLLLVGAFLLPLALTVWKQSRMAGAITLISSVVAAIAINTMFQHLGYVKLLGLPHILLWTPVVIYLFGQSKRDDMPVWPRRMIWGIIALLLVSLAFDYIDVVRYPLGERAAVALSPAG